MYQQHAFAMDERSNMNSLLRLLRSKDLVTFSNSLKGLDVHMLNNETLENYTIMQHAVVHGYHDFVDALLAVNVNANIGNDMNKPVLLAAEYGYWRILKSFMDYRWQVTKKCLIRFDVWTDPSGENVLHLGK